MRLTRVGHVFTVAEADDAATRIWHTVGTATIPMTAEVRVGLAVTSHRDGARCTAVFDRVALVGTPTAAN